MIDQTESIAIRAARNRLWKHRSAREAATKVLASPFASEQDRAVARENVSDCDRQIRRIEAELHSLGVEP